MRRVIVCNIMSLDGYYADPDGNPMALPMDEAFDAYNLERMQSAGTVLLGRTSYDGFGSYWPFVVDHPASPPEDRAHSATNRETSRLYNSVEKAVVTDQDGPAEDHPWARTTTVVGRDDVGGWLAAQREHPDGTGDILVYGSHVLWNALLGDGLVDELHLMVGNVVLGGGTPIFTGPVSGLALVDVRRFEGSDNAVLRYRAGGSQRPG